MGGRRAMSGAGGRQDPGLPPQEPKERAFGTLLAPHTGSAPQGFPASQRTAGSGPPASAPTKARRRLLPIPSPDSPEQGRTSRRGAQAREPHTTALGTARPRRPLMAPRPWALAEHWRRQRANKASREGRKAGGAERGREGRREGGERKGARRRGVGKKGGAEGGVEGRREGRVGSLEERWPPPHLSPPLSLLDPIPDGAALAGPKEKHVSFC